MFASKHRKYKLFPLVNRRLSQGCPSSQKVYVFKVDVPFISSTHPSRDVIFFGQISDGKKKTREIISAHDVWEPLKQALLASRDVIVSSQICVLKFQRVFSHQVTDAGCPFFLPCHGSDPRVRYSLKPLRGPPTHGVPNPPSSKTINSKNPKSSRMPYFFKSKRSFPKRNIFIFLWNF